MPCRVSRLVTTVWLCVRHCLCFCALQVFCVLLALVRGVTVVSGPTGYYNSQGLRVVLEQELECVV